MRRYFLRSATGLLVLAGIAAGSAVARADEAPTAMLVVDGSGSMWARLPPDNRAKIDIVREKLTTVLQTPSSTRVGLVSFGHRRRGDCNDVELIAPPDAARDGILAPLAKLNPRGPGPVTAALKVAIDAVGSARPAQIVLVGDGADNCKLDPCILAADFAKTSPGVPIHVIGIGIPANDRPRLACISEATGGRFYDISDSNGLNAALDEATRLAILSPGAAGASAQANAPAAPPPPAGASIRVSAALAKNGPLLALPLRWRIFKSGDTTAVGENEGRDITAKLAAGSYDVEAQLGSITARQQVTVADGAAESIVLPLDAAHLVVRAAAVKGGDPSPTATLTVQSGDTPVAISRNGAVDLYLPPADYQVTVEDGIARTTQSVTLAAGDDKPIDVVLGTGRLDISAAGADGTALSDILYAVFEDDPESADGRREVARSRAPEASFTLPAGTYYVSARSGAADVQQRIAVGIGETVKKTLTLALAPLKVATTVAGSPVTPEQSIVYRIDRLDGDGMARVARAIGSDLAINLPAGRYKISAALASSNLSATEEVTLEAGKTATVALNIAAGAVSFVAPRHETITNGDTYWEVFDGKGMTVWRATGADPKTLLAPGHYTVRLQFHSGRREASFDVKSGEPQQVEIGPG
jgi:Ca-activated chloride channel family protein